MLIKYNFNTIKGCLTEDGLCVHLVHHKNLNQELDKQWMPAQCSSLGYNVKLCYVHVSSFAF